MPSFLRQYHILDLTGGGFRLASRLLADMGAEVIRIVPPDYIPRPADVFYDAGINLIPLDFNHPDGRAMLLDLMLGTDVFIESYPPGFLTAYGLSYKQVNRENPGLIYASVTPFGQSGPYRHWASSDTVLQAMSGWLAVTGEPAQPISLPGEQASHTAALFAINGVLLALRRRRQTGRGQYLDIAAVESGSAVLDHVLVRHTIGEVPRRQGNLHWNSMFGIFPCRDGKILLSIHRQWETLVDWMAAEGKADDLADDKYRDEAYRRQNIAHIIEVIERWTMNHTAEELAETGQLMRFPWAKVASPQAVLNDAYLTGCGFFDIIRYNGNELKMPEVFR